MCCDFVLEMEKSDSISWEENLDSYSLSSSFSLAQQNSDQWGFVRHKYMMLSHLTYLEFERVYEKFDEIYMKHSCNKD